MSTKTLSWEDIEGAVADLAEKIEASGFVPDYIIGIATGGLIPLYFLANKLAVENILTISATKHEGKEHRFLSITYMPEVNLGDKKVLLIDDIAEGGSTLKEMVVMLMDRYEVEALKTATIAANVAKSDTQPDFYAIEKQDEWITFPWEKKS